MTGKAPLRTFGELKALFEAKKPKEEGPIPIEAVPQPSAPTAEQASKTPAAPDATSEATES
jgi:hypothetical protein